MPRGERQERRFGPSGDLIGGFLARDECIREGRIKETVPFKSALMARYFNCRKSKSAQPQSATSWSSNTRRTKSDTGTGKRRSMGESPPGPALRIPVAMPTYEYLLNAPVARSHPVWQPDGQFLLFTSGFTGNQSHISHQERWQRGIETVLKSEGIDETRDRSIVMGGT